MNDQGKPDLLRLHQLTTNPLLICRIKGESPWRPRFSRACSRVFGVLGTGRMNDQGRLNILRLNQLTTIPLLRCHIKVESPLRPRFSRACSRVFGVLRTSRMNDQGQPDILRLHQLATVSLLRCHVKMESPWRPRFSRACSRVFGVLMVNSFPHMRNESVILSPKVSPMISFTERGILVAVFQKALRWSGGWELSSPQLSCMKLKCDYSDQHPDSPKRFMRVFYLLCQKISNRISLMQLLMEGA